MIPFETFAVIGLFALLGVGAVVLFVVLRKGDSSRATERLNGGHFEEALAAASGDSIPDRDALLAAAVAAKHLLQLDRARELLRLALRDDPRDGEAWLELGLVDAYRGELDEAAIAFERAAASRADLLESITLHRSWLALRRDDRPVAHALFSEIEAPLETKLRTDLGEGEPVFAEWFLHAGLLWRSRGDKVKADWAIAAAERAAPMSLLVAEEAHRSGRPASLQ